MSNIHTPTKHVVSKNSIVPTAYTTDTGAHNGTGIDCFGMRAAKIEVDANITAGTSTTFTIDDSDDNISFNADVYSAANEFAVVVPSGATGTQLNHPGHQVMSVNLEKRKRYIRVVATNAGGVTGVVSAKVDLFGDFYQAVSQDNPDIVNA